MNQKTLMWLAVSVLTLAACTGQPATSGGGQKTQSASAATVASAPQTTLANQQDKIQLKSSDGKISIDTSGQFVDKMGDATLMPEGVPAEKVKLLQLDNSTGTLFTVVEAGKTKAENVSAYFDKVKVALEADKSLSNLVIGDISANTMTYHFSQTSADNQILLNERCMIMLNGESLYNVCVSNPDMNQEELAEALEFINTIQ